MWGRVLVGLQGAFSSPPFAERHVEVKGCFCGMNTWGPCIVISPQAAAGAPPKLRLCFVLKGPSPRALLPLVHKGKIPWGAHPNEMWCTPIAALRSGACTTLATIHVYPVSTLLFLMKYCVPQNNFDPN